MSHQEALCQWVGVVSRQLPKMSRRQAAILGLYSYGMVLTRRSGLSVVADLLAKLCGKRVNSVRQCLREWCYDAADKRGQGRREVVIEEHFGDLLRWILSWWQGRERQLVLALDTTLLRQTFVVLVVSVVYRGCAIPVAWCVLPARQVGTWQPHWLRLLDHIHQAIPKGWWVLVLTDRGLYAKWLYQGIRRYGWHPFMRINRRGQYRLRRGTKWRDIDTLVRQDGRLWARRVLCFKSAHAQLSCTLLACWQPAYADPWLILTDLPVTQTDIAWYGWRSWIEAGFKDFKRGGWRWEQTKMSHPSRAARLWFVMSVATLWALSLGCETFDSNSTIPTLKRSLSCFAAGLNLILAHVIAHRPIPVGRFMPLYCPKPPT